MISLTWITNGTKTPFYLRRSFSIKSTPVSAKALVCGLGQFNFYLNGSRAGDRLLDPPWTDYRKQVQAVDFDVTDLLKPGANALGLEVGNGWYIWDQSFGYIFAFPPFMPPNPNPYRPYGDSLVAAVELVISYADGTEDRISTSDPAGWLTAPHPVLHSNVYGSEEINGSLAQPGFSLPEFDASGWTQARSANEGEIPQGDVVQAQMPPIKVIHCYEGKEIGCVNGHRIFDLGQNVAGLLHCAVRGKAGQQVEFLPAEKLTPEGDVDQMAKGWMPINNVISYCIGADDVWEPVSQSFTYFSGRYIAVSENAEVRNLVGDAITSAWKETGHFTCDDERYNKIYDMIEKTVEANMVSVHTDCPTIERFAWQEPNHLMAPSIFFMKDGKALWEKFFSDLRLAQHTADDIFYDFAGNPFPAGAGLVPSQAPCYVPNVLPVPGMGSFYDIIPWGSTCILGVYWHYLFYGDQQVIEDNYETGKRYLEHLKSKMTQEGFINHGLGDWGNPDQALARENVETAFLYADAAILAYFARILKKPEEEAAFHGFAEKVRQNYNEKLLVQGPDGKWFYRNWEDQTALTATQACEALPLFWDMVPADQVDDVAACFKRTLEEKGSFAAGEIGLPYIIQTASRLGLDDLIARFITRPEHPSYYAFVLDGMTTLGEYWENNPRSHCHDMMGHIIEWYYSGIAGIKPLEPGFKRVQITPHMPESMNTFTCSYETPYGTITVSGTREAGAPVYEIYVPDAIELER